MLNYFEDGDKPSSRMQKMTPLHQEFGQTNISADIRAFSHEMSNLVSYRQQIQETLEMIRNFTASVLPAAQKLEQEFQDLNLQKHQCEGELSEFEVLQNQKKGRIRDLRDLYAAKKKERVTVALSINLKELGGLQMEDRRSQGHDVFLWILLVVYKEPVSKYYWSNFKEQAFEGDGGADFKQRMGRMSATDLREEDILLSRNLLGRRGNLEGSPEFVEASGEIKKIFEVVQLIMDGHNASSESREIQREQLRSKDSRMLREERVCMIKGKINAIQDRKNLNLKYLKVLQTLEQSLEQKGKIYAELKEQQRDITSQLESMRGESHNDDHYCDINGFTNVVATDATNDDHDEDQCHLDCMSPHSSHHPLLPPLLTSLGLRRDSDFILE